MDRTSGAEEKSVTESKQFPAESWTFELVADPDSHPFPYSVASFHSAPEFLSLALSLSRAKRRLRALVRQSCVLRS